MEIKLVEKFLKDFKEKLVFWGLIFRVDRGKNTATLLELEYSVTKVKEVLKELLPQDYNEGPLTDTLFKGTDMWVFGKTLKQKEVYIKISLGSPGTETLCISFHFAEHPLYYPFKKKPL